MGDDKVIPDWLAERREEKGTWAAPVTSIGLWQAHDNPVTRDVAFNRHSMNDGHHVSPSDNGIVQVGTDGLKVALVQGIDVPQLQKTLTAAVRATVGLDLNQALPGDWEPCPHKGAICEMGHEDHRPSYGRGPEDFEGKVPMQDWEEMLRGGLQTALETQTVVFAVGGASRTCTHQLVRSRRAAFHQQSQRAGYMGDMPEVRMPDSIWNNLNARQAFLRAVMASWRAYREICEYDISYQDARFVLPEGTTNFILLEYPIREFLNLYAYRGCYMFQWEIVEVMHQCRQLLVDEYPWLEPYIKISCEKTGPVLRPFAGQHQERVAEHHCTFQGWEDVEGQCPFSWAKHEARTFKPEFHRITRKEDAKS